MFRRNLALLVVASAVFAAYSASAFASDDAPGWRVSSLAYPTNLSPGQRGFIEVDLFNVGAATNSSPVTVTDVLPEGVTFTGAQPRYLGTSENEYEPWACSGAAVVTCTSTKQLAPGRERVLDLEVNVTGGILPGAYPNRVTASGGGALGAASMISQITLSATAARFGLTGFETWATNADGTPATQAGSHPYEMTTSLRFSAEMRGIVPTPVGDVKELEVGLPAGLVVNPTATPTLCTEPQLAHVPGQADECPASSQVGVVHLHVGAYVDVLDAVYNMVPPTGEPAELGFLVEGTTAVHILPVIRTASDSGISASAAGLGQVEFLKSALTLWGNPSDASHDGQRAACSNGSAQLEEPAPLCPVERTDRPLLTLPSSCDGPLTATVRLNSWQEPEFLQGSFTGESATESVTACERLSLHPSFTAAPDTAQADAPAGLTFDLKTPQDGLTAPNALAAPDLRTTTVTLPAGVAINPGQAAGLVACQPGEDAVGTNNAPSCPAASKVGTVEITTPLLTSKLYGNVYVLPSEPPDVKLMIAASIDGVNLKLVGDAHLNESTGQITTTFADTPQLPFDELKLAFSGGAQAALTTPTTCGVYTTVGDFTPWSSPFAPDAIGESAFGIASGPDGSPCSSIPMLFYPTLTAGSTTDQAGGFTNFSLLLQRGDGQQRIERLRFRAPAGLSAMLAQVPLCPEPQAVQGACPAASHIGHAVVASGPGPYPLVLPQPGAPELPIFLTGPYKGAPFGLSIVTPVVAGPFDLGTIVTRASIAVDPITAQITVTTDPLPQVVKGVPTDLRQINSVIDRPGFMFNPTNCDPQSFSGTAWGTPPPGAGGPGATAPISSHFGVGSCRSLEFHPKFSVSTSGKTSRANGASLTAKLSYPNAPQGSQANITRVKVDLPKQLPSRLTTLQKACTSAQFELNPANCPAASKIGMVTVTTPLLPVPLMGPAIFVSHGGEAFPSLTMVLQGYGVTVDLVGTTFISKAGITSTTFKTVPDVPFNTFELKLPEGKFSALAANGNLCNSKLAIPTAFLAQNGLVIHQSTKIAVTGCAKHKAKRAKKHGKHKGRRRPGRR